MSRETGWYRVKFLGFWQFAYFDGELFGDAWEEIELDDIDPTPVNPVPADEVKVEKYERPTPNGKWPTLGDPTQLICETTEIRVMQDNYDVLKEGK